MDRTLVICKPDAVERGLVGEIVSRLERKQLHIVAIELRRLDAEIAGRHYAEHEGKPFFGDLVSFITRSPSVLMVIEGPEETYAVVRLLMGVTNPRGGARHHPRRPGRRAHREPGARLRLPGVGQAGDRHLFPQSVTGAWTRVFVNSP